MMFFEHLSRITEPLRLRDFHSHIRALGLPEFRPPMAVSPVLTFLAAPIRHLGESVGAFYVGEKDVEFALEDEELLHIVSLLGHSNGYYDLLLAHHRLGIVALHLPLPGLHDAAVRVGGISPNPPMDRDGWREDSGRGEGVTGAMIRA